jgi:hypothetical protein
MTVHQRGTYATARNRVFFSLVVSVVTACAVVLTGCNRDKSATASEKASQVTNAEVRPAPGPALPQQPATTDPTVALERMVAAYKALDSLQVSMEADIFIQVGKTNQMLHQKTTLNYVKQPPQAVMKVKDTGSGTTEFHSDGSSVVVYSGMRNKYRRYNRGGSLADISRAVDEKGPQIFSPFVFLQSDRLPLGVTGLSMKPKTTLNGKPALVVSGRFTEKFLRDFGKRIELARGMTPTVGKFTLWLDAGNYLLLQHSSEMAWRGRVLTSGDTVPIENPRIVLFEKTTEIIMNPTFPADFARFIPPKGAREEFVERLDQ